MSDHWPGFRKLTLAAAVLIALGSVFTWRALAPIHAVGDASECEQAYAKASTRTDSLAVDLMSYPDPLRRGVSQRCGWRSATPMQLIQR